MAKCYFTGVEAPAQEMFVLDVAAARKALKDLRQRTSAVERLMEQLNVKDDEAIYDIKRRRSINIKVFRLINKGVAEVLSATYPWMEIFIGWDDFLMRRRMYRKMHEKGKDIDTTHLKTELQADERSGS